MSNVIPSSLNPPANRKQRRAAKSQHVEAAPVLTLLQGRQMQTPRREPELANDDEFEDPAPKTVSFAEANPGTAEILANAKITVVEPEEDEFYEELARVEAEDAAAAERRAAADEAEESAYVPPISAPKTVQVAPVEEEEAVVAAPACVAVQTTVESSLPVEAVQQAAPAVQQAVKPGFGAKLVAAIRRVLAATVTLVKWVDWVAVGILCLIPLMVLAAYAYGAVSTVVAVAAVMLIGTVVRLLGTEVVLAWAFQGRSKYLKARSRSKYLKAMLEASLVLGIGLLLLVAQGSVWQALVGSLVFFLFATRRRASA